MTNNQAKFKQPTLVILYALRFRTSTTEYSAALQQQRHKKAYIGEWLRQAGCRFQRNVNLTI